MRRLRQRAVRRPAFPALALPGRGLARARRAPRGGGPGRGRTGAGRALRRCRRPPRRATGSTRRWRRRSWRRRSPPSPGRACWSTCDYGKSWPELCEATPDGTARAYCRHRQSNALLANPGEQDLTCHVCWDWIAAELYSPGLCRRARFAPRRHSSCATPAGAWPSSRRRRQGRFSARKLALTQLLHPAHLGQKFQVLTAFRAEAK